MGVVVRGRELQVEEGAEGAEVANSKGAHYDDGVDEAVIDEDVDAAVFHHAVRAS